MDDLNPQTAPPAPADRSFAERLQTVPRHVIYLILVLCASVPLFFPITLPNKPLEPSIDFYGQVMSIPEGGRVLIGSDWTKGTRGESMGEMEAVLKILMRRHIKFGVYSTGDPQSPQVSRDTIDEVNASLVQDGYPPYKPFEDYVILGYFPNGDGTNTAINNDVLAAFRGKTDTPAGGSPTDVLTSPVFQGVHSVADFGSLILITPSNTERSTIERVKKTPLMFMVTGVMVPEDQVYYTAGQLKGLVGGVKGVFDIETLMDKGIAPQTATGAGLIKSDHFPDGVPGFPGKHNSGKGTAYYLTLHFTLGLLVLAVVIGNLGVLLAGRKKA